MQCSETTGRGGSDQYLIYICAQVLVFVCVCVCVCVCINANVNSQIFDEALSVICPVLQNVQDQAEGNSGEFKNHI